MSIKSRKDLLFGGIVLAVGVVYLVLTMQLPRGEGIDSATVPYILALLMVVLGAVQLILASKAVRLELERARSLRSEIMAAAAPANKEEEAALQAAPLSRPDYRTVAVTGGLIFFYVVLLDTFGFMVMSALYLFLQIALLTPKYGRANYGKYAFIAVVASVCIYYVFFWAFDIMLPHGEFWYDLGVDFEWSPFE